MVAVEQAALMTLKCAVGRGGYRGGGRGGKSI